MGGILNDGKLAAVLCVAGGWAGGNAASDGDLRVIYEFKIIIEDVYLN